MATVYHSAVRAAAEAESSCLPSCLDGQSCDDIDSARGESDYVCDIVGYNLSTVCDCTGCSCLEHEHSSKSSGSDDDDVNEWWLSTTAIIIYSVLGGLCLVGTIIAVCFFYFKPSQSGEKGLNKRQYERKWRGMRRKGIEFVTFKRGEMDEGMTKFIVKGEALQETFADPLRCFGEFYGSRMLILNLAHCSHVTGDLSCLSSMTNARKINLWGCKNITGDLSSLTPCVSLDELQLFECVQVTGKLTDLAPLTNLVELRLAGVQVEGNLRDLKHLQALEVLVLWNCFQVKGKLDSLEGLKALKVINLANCREVSGSLKSFSMLIELNFINLASRYPMKITGSPEDIYRLTFMKKCNLEGCKRTLTGTKEEFEKRLPMCEFFI